MDEETRLKLIHTGLVQFKLADDGGREAYDRIIREPRDGWLLTGALVSREVVGGALVWRRDPLAIGLGLDPVLYWKAKESNGGAVAGGAVLASFIRRMGLTVGLWEATGGFVTGGFNIDPRTGERGGRQWLYSEALADERTTVEEVKASAERLRQI